MNMPTAFTPFQNLKIRWRILKNSKYGSIFLWAFSVYSDIWDICDHLQLVSCNFIKSSSNESILNKSFQKFVFTARPKNAISKKTSKPHYFDKALWPNHLTYSKPYGISGETISISFIWCPGIWNLFKPWVTVALWKWWPTKGSGGKWVISSYPLACPCSSISSSFSLVRLTRFLTHRTQSILL